MPLPGGTTFACSVSIKKPQVSSLFSSRWFLRGFITWLANERFTWTAHYFDHANGRRANFPRHLSALLTQVKVSEEKRHKLVDFNHWNRLILASWERKRQPLASWFIWYILAPRTLKRRQRPPCYWS
jgi:hypothetical protein